MIKHIISIFMRDLKVNMRSFLGGYMIIAPIIIALAINAFVPGINDSTLRLGFIEGDNPEMVEYYKDYAKVEVFSDLDELKYRVNRRDEFIGIVNDGDSYYIMTQGNESKGALDFAKVFKSYYDLEFAAEDSTAEIISYNRTVPPIKKGWTNLSLIMVSVIGGMLIGLNIVEEKVDNTISAINMTPVYRTSFILGKSLIGMLTALIGSIAIILITGFGSANLIQVSLLIFSVCIISILIGFLEGVKNDDVMNAVGNIKMLLLPMIAGICAFEFLSDKWQPLFYWIPFYWAYKGNDAVLDGTATWGQTLLYSGIILALSVAVYLYVAPKIRDGLEQ